MVVVVVARVVVVALVVVTARMVPVLVRMTVLGTVPELVLTIGRAVVVVGTRLRSGAAQAVQLLAMTHRPVFIRLSHS